MSSKRPQFILRGTGFVAVTAACLSALLLGAILPFAWSMLAFLTVILFSILVFRNVVVTASPIPSHLIVSASVFIAVLTFCTVLSSLSTLPAYNESGLPSANPDAGLRGALRLGLYGMLFMIAAYAFNAGRSAATAMRLLAIWSTMVAAYGFYAFFTGINPILGDLDAGMNVKSSFVNQNHYATYAAFGTIVNLGTYVGMIEGRKAIPPIKRRVREMIERFFGGAWIYAVGTLLCGAATAATASKAGVMSGLFGLLIFSAAWTIRARKLRYATYAVIILGLGLVIYSSSTNLFDGFSALDEQKGRLIVWHAVIQGILDRPLLGHGLGSFEDSFKQYLPLEAAHTEWSEAHNSYIENYFEMGILGATLLYLCLVPIVWRIYRATWIRQRDREFSCVALGCLATGGLHAALDSSLQIPAVTAFFAIILGIGWTKSFSKAEATQHIFG